MVYEKSIKSFFKYISDMYRKYREYRLENAISRDEELPKEYLNVCQSINQFFPNYLKEFIENNEKITFEYNFKGSHGQGERAPVIPWISIENNLPNSQNRCYVTYLFDAEYNVVYLTFLLKTSEYRTGSSGESKYFLSGDYERINKDAKFLNQLCRELLPFDFRLFDNNSMKLNCNSSENKCQWAKSYENGVIFNKYYDINSLPEEEILKDDLINFIKFYESFEQNKIYDCLNNPKRDSKKNIYEHYIDFIDKYNDASNDDFIMDLNDLKLNFLNFILNLKSTKYLEDCEVELSYNKDNLTVEIRANYISNNYYDGFCLSSRLNDSDKCINVNFRLSQYLFDGNFRRNLINYAVDLIKNNFRDMKFKINKDEITTKINYKVNDFEYCFEKIMCIYDYLIYSYVHFIFKNYLLVDNHIFSNSKLLLQHDELKKKLGDDFIMDDMKLKELCSSLNTNNIILSGIPGTGKTKIAKYLSELATEKKFIDGYIFTTATSDWTTFELIGGLMPNNDGSLDFYEGKFLESISSNKWLIIDEINRADIDKAFGQLFTVLSNQNIELPFKKNNKPIKIEHWENNYSCVKGSTYYIGKNWRIIGTMNDIDKNSLFDLSYAFMRRFMFITIDVPQYTSLKLSESKIIKNNKDKFKSLYEFTSSKIGPALYFDMMSYIDELSKNESEDNIILKSAIKLYVFPQYDNLNNNEFEKFKEILEEFNFDENEIKLSKFDI